jgi:hypothetical protein
MGIPVRADAPGTVVPAADGTCAAQVPSDARAMSLIDRAPSRRADWHARCCGRRTAIDVHRRGNDTGDSIMKKLIATQYPCWAADQEPNPANNVRDIYVRRACSCQ